MSYSHTDLSTFIKMCGYLCIEVDVYIDQHLCEIMSACACVNVYVVVCAPASVCTDLYTFAYLSIWYDLVGPGLVLSDLVYMFAPLFAPPYVRVARHAHVLAAMPNCPGCLQMSQDSHTLSHLGSSNTERFNAKKNTMRKTAPRTGKQKNIRATAVDSTAS